MSNAQLIDQAIGERRRLGFTYHGTARIVEPQCHGRHHGGTELLRGYQINGNTERLFDVSQIAELALLDDHFDGPGPHYKRNDSAMAEIYRQL